MKNKTTASLSLRKLLLSTLVAAPLATLPAPLWALPGTQALLDAQIASTSAGVTVTSTSATKVDVTATQSASVIQWNNFGATGMTIVSGDTINYDLPTTTSSILNMVGGTQGTTVNGTLSSDGRIYILNPNGITIGATGVINAAGVGLSTVPETDYNFLTTGELSGIENQNVATYSGVTVNPAAKITAASGSGNVWIVGKGVDLAGTVAGGNVTVNSVRDGNIVLGSGGDLVVGNATVGGATLTATTAPSGTITVSNNVTVNGPSVTLTAGGNSAVTQTGVLTIGSGNANSSLTVNAGTGAVSIADVRNSGTGTVAVGLTSGAATVGSGAGKLAVGGSTAALTIGATGDLTINASEVDSLTASSTAGNILSGGQVETDGAVSLTVADGKNIAINLAETPASLTLANAGGAFGTLSVTQATGNITAQGGITAGNVTFVATAGDVSIGAGGQTVTGTATYTAGDDIVIDNGVNAGNLVATAADSLTLNAPIDSTGNVTLTATAGDLTTTAAGTIGAFSATKRVTLTAGDDITLGGTIAAENISVSAGSDIAQNAAFTVNGGNVTLTATAGNVSVDGGITGTALNVTASAGAKLTTTQAISATGNVSLTSTGNAAIDAISAARVTISGGTLVSLDDVITATNVTATAAGDLDVNGTIDSTAANTGTVALTATAGNVTIDNTIGAVTTHKTLNVTAGKIIDVNSAVVVGTDATLTATGNVSIDAALTAPTVTISGAAITDGAAGSITSSTKATISGSNAVTLDGSNNFAKLVLTGAAGNVTINDTNALTLDDGTNATGNVTITAGGTVTLGSTASGNVTVGKKLSITTSGGDFSVLDATNNVDVGGDASFTASGTGTVVLDGATGNGIGLNSTFGAVSITTTNQNATIYERAVLNLGTVNLGTGVLKAYSLASIDNSGKLTIGGAQVGAGTAAAPGVIELDYVATDGTSNAIGGTVDILDDLTLLGQGTAIGGLPGNYLASSLKIRNGVSTANLVDVDLNIYGQGISADLDLATVKTANLTVGALRTTGAVTLGSEDGSITATSANSTFTSVTVNSENTTGASAISSATDLTVNGVVAGDQQITFTASNGNVTIGDYRSSNTGTTVFAASKAVTDSVSGLSIFGPVTFNGATVAITRAGHSFGGVKITTTGNGSAIISESGTLNLLGVSTGSGAITATSTNGSIIQGTGTTGIITSGSATFTANTGGVTLTDEVNNSMTGVIALSAVNASEIENKANANIKLGSVTVAAGNLTVDALGTGAITQNTGASIYAYGATAFTSAGGNITVANAGNQFGALTLTSGGGAVSLSEQTTVNLASVNTGGGALTVTSVGGSIIDSGNVLATGTASFTATSGDIVLDRTASSYGTVKLSTGGNATIVDGVGNLVLDTSSVGGALSVTNSTGNISQLGALTVGGDATFIASAAASSLLLNNLNNSFGAFQFRVGTGGTLVNELTDFVLRAGSISTGMVTINTAGLFDTSGVGGSSITNDLTVNAVGTIIPRAGSLLVTGTFTVNSGSLKDLSALSLSGNLAGKDPVNLGTGSYVPPSP